MLAARLVLLAALAACTPAKPEGTCLFWTDCGENGACEYTASVDGMPRFDCSFPDATCESGRRFGEFASSERAGTCVEFSPFPGGICDEAHDCGERVECQLNRCVNVQALDATAEAFIGHCSSHLVAGGDIYLWGFALEIFPTPIEIGVFVDAAPLTAAAAALPMPPPVINTRVASMGANHLCAIASLENGDDFSACIGLAGNAAVGADPDGVPTLAPWSDNPFGAHSMISAGNTHTCGVRGNNIDCWGLNDERQLDGTAADIRQASVQLPNRIGSVATGKTFSCAGTTMDVFCWGGDHWADGTFTADDGSVATLVGIDPPGAVTAIAAGEAHACAIVDGILWCWGANDSGQVTGESSIAPQRPFKPIGDTAILTVTAGRAHTCVVTADHTVMCWGSNDAGQLGFETSLRSPQVVPLEARAVGPLAATDDATCALLESSFLQCWGAPELTTEAQPIPLARFPICLE